MSREYDVPAATFEVWSREFVNLSFVVKSNPQVLRLILCSIPFIASDRVGEYKPVREGVIFVHVTYTHIDREGVHMEMEI